MKNSYLFHKIVIELVALEQQKALNWVILMHILLCLYFQQIFDFLVTDIFPEKGIINFSGNVSTGTDLATNFDLVKCKTKDKYK